MNKENFYDSCVFNEETPTQAGWFVTVTKQYEGDTIRTHCTPGLPEGYKLPEEYEADCYFTIEVQQGGSEPTEEIRSIIHGMPVSDEGFTMTTVVDVYRTDGKRDRRPKKHPIPGGTGGK